MHALKIANFLNFQRKFPFFKKIINEKNKLYYIFFTHQKKTKQLLVKKILFIPDIA